MQSKDHIRTNEPIYKIGRTGNIHERMSGYGGSAAHRMLTIAVDDVERAEDTIKQALRNNSPAIRPRKDVGSEYFSGNYLIILALVVNTALLHHFIDIRLEKTPNDVHPPEAAKTPAKPAKKDDKDDKDTAPAPAPAQPRQPPARTDHSLLVRSFIKAKYAALGHCRTVMVERLFAEYQEWVSGCQPADSPGAKAAIQMRTWISLVKSAFRCIKLREFPSADNGGLPQQAFVFPPDQASADGPQQQPEQPAVGAVDNEGTQLATFLSMKDNERGWKIEHAPGKVTWVSEFKAAFDACMGIVSRDLYQQSHVFHAFDFQISAGPQDRSSICMACKQLSSTRYRKCCENYNRSNRAVKTVLFNMRLSALSSVQ